VNAKEDDEIMIDFKGDKRTTPKAALAEIAELKNGAELTETEKKLLNDLESYLQKEFV
jgi:hypothetical protein